LKIQRQKHKQAAEREIRILELIQKSELPNGQENYCAKLLDWFNFNDYMCMVFPIYGPSLIELLEEENYKPFKIEPIRSFAKNILTAVSFIHRCGIAHGDIKPENILLASRETFTTETRLLDFGLAVFREDHHSRVVGTRQYSPPEIILGIPWDFPLDIWSVGCVLYELYSGSPLFDTHENREHLALMEQRLEKHLNILLKMEN